MAPREPSIRLKNPQIDEPDDKKKNLSLALPEYPIDPDDEPANIQYQSSIFEKFFNLILCRLDIF